ncbi:sugar phosphate isomerase/epimerase family protein [Compostimonas suwonensis]|uniref:Sugar phosphate isomerase/epimerase n=1 Tax=Compostimonas suwonensis TaxID=1048394 RepID=A0A2M9C0B1_9MICO|nr:sugar phosphate isomerase/epimerase family protein [Compostimonas suwonensis]PJJ63762.1 sugar phosphate isomerase/epimerase [Compostimonas suwonensis]
MSSRLSLNQGTVRTATLAEALDACVEVGVESIGVWRDRVEPIGLDEAARRLSDSGLRLSSLCRAVFVTAPEGPERRAAIDENHRAIDETATLYAAAAAGSTAMLVMVAGPLAPGERDLAAARGRVRDAIGELESHARDAGVRLALEPLHPMFAADRSVVSTLGTALDLVEPFPKETVGVIVDTFHLWWDAQLAADIARAGREGRVASYQVSDWITPVPSDLMLARGMMGDGHIDFATITRSVAATGFDGDVEVEIFNQEIWDSPYVDVVRLMRERYDALIEPYLRSDES